MSLNTSHLRGSHGLSAWRPWMTKSSRPEGTKAHPKGHKLAPIGLHFYYGYFLIMAKTDKYVYKVYMDMEVSEDWGDGQTNSARVWSTVPIVTGNWQALWLIFASWHRPYHTNYSPFASNWCFYNIQLNQSSEVYLREMDALCSCWTQILTEAPFHLLLINESRSFGPIAHYHRDEKGCEKEERKEECIKI